MPNKYISDQSNQFKNKIIIVTGSTQGSGAETAKLLASRGAKGITICGRNRDTVSYTHLTLPTIYSV